MVGIHPRNHILDPREIVFFHSSCKFYAIFNADVTKVVDSKRYFIADDLAYFLDVIFKEVKSLFCQMDARVGVSGGNY